MDVAVDDAAAAQPVINNNPADPSPAAAFSKRKRTKRHRPPPPHSPNNIPFSISTPPPPPLPADYLRLSPLSDDTTTTEDVETAQCLLLLSQRFPPRTADSDGGDIAPPLPKRPSAAAGGGAYTCKTCNRTFSSFQALGGHRTSHRKIRNDKKSAAPFSDDEDFPSPGATKFPPNSLSLQLSTIPAAATKPSASPRMHECSYCGAEFTSGQALGGHMRKHRTGPIVARSSNIPIDASIEWIEIEESKRHKNGFPLDLNLPASEDENHKFGLGKGQQEKDKAEAGPGLDLPLTPLLIDKV